MFTKTDYGVADLGNLSKERIALFVFSLLIISIHSSNSTMDSIFVGPVTSLKKNRWKSI